ncbi:MAG: divergent polysaccharide deacetylase family protein [Paracoccaceae bacterium]
MRGFVRGLVWGSLAAAGGLVVLSQIAGPIKPVVELPQDDAPAVAAAPAAATPDPVVPGPIADVPKPIAETPDATEEVSAAISDVGAVDTAAAPESRPPVAVTEAPVAQDSAALATDAPMLPAPSETTAAQSRGEAPAAPEADSAAAMAPAPAEPPVAPPSDAPAERMASAGQVSPPVAPATGDTPFAAAQPEAPALPEAEGAPVAADLPPLPPLTPEEEALLAPLPEVPADVTRAEPAPSNPVPPMPLPEPDAPAGGEGALAATPDLANQAPGVVTGRLPRIGADAAPAPEAGPEAAPDGVAGEGLPPRQRYARPFDNAAQKPLFAILLQDNGQDGVNRAELAALDLPLSIVIDPLSEGAAERAAIWRAGGQEVVMAGTGIPVGAGPGDLEQSFQVLSARMPEAVAVVDPDGRTFQNNGPLAAQVVPILVEQGRGLVTFDQGLNAADRQARREGLVAAVIYRSIDGEGEDSPVIRRYLDRAAFKAAQEGRVIVIGALRPETVAGVLQWAVEGRAATVALAPISAMLQD